MNATNAPVGTSNKALATLSDFDLDQKIADRIRMIERALADRDRALEMVEKCEKSAVLSAWRLGHFLIERKGRLEHGAWLPWLNSSGISSSSAADYMRLARQISSAGNLGSSIRATLRALPPPSTTPKSKPERAVVEPEPEPESHDKQALVNEGLEKELYAEREKTGTLEERISIMEEAADPKTRKTSDKINNQAELIKTLKSSVANWQDKASTARKENASLKRKIKALETELGRSRPRHAA